MSSAVQINAFGLPNTNNAKLYLHSSWRQAGPAQGQHPTLAPPSLQPGFPSPAYQGKPHKPTIVAKDVQPGAFFYLSANAASKCPSLYNQLSLKANMLATDHPIFVINKKGGSDVDIMIATSYNGYGLLATKQGLRDDDYHFEVVVGGSDAARTGTSDHAKRKVFVTGQGVLKASTCIRAVLYTIQWRLLEPYMVNNCVQNFCLEESSLERLRTAAKMIQSATIGDPFSYSRLPPLEASDVKSDLAKILERAKGRPNGAPVVAQSVYMGPPPMRSRR